MQVSIWILLLSLFQWIHLINSFMNSSVWLIQWINEFTLCAGKSMNSSIFKRNSFIKSICLIVQCCYVSTLGSNIHKQELFVMAIRTPTGKTFPGNYTIIPSSKKWLFHSIFCLAFLSLYGEQGCSMNRLVLTNEEDAEIVHSKPW